MTTEQDHAKDYLRSTRDKAPLEPKQELQRLFRIFERDSAVVVQTADSAVVVQLGLERSAAPMGLDVLVSSLERKFFKLLALLSDIGSCQVELQGHELAFRLGNYGRFTFKAVPSTLPLEYGWLDIPAIDRIFVGDVDGAVALRQIRWALRSIGHSDPEVLIIDNQGRGHLPVTRWHAASQNMPEWPPAILSRNKLEWLQGMLVGKGGSVRFYRLPNDGGGRTVRRSTSRNAALCGSEERHAR